MEDIEYSVIMLEDYPSGRNKRIQSPRFAGRGESEKWYADNIKRLTAEFRAELGQRC